MTRTGRKHPEVFMRFFAMRKNIAVCALLLGASLLVPAAAMATPPGSVGEKNFGRAIIALRGNNDATTAAGYFKRAADAFAQLMTNNAEAGKKTRLSRLLMAGMSSYHAGNMQQAEKIMSAAAADSTAWEAPLYAGLALARMGKSAEAAAMWQRFSPDAGQRMIGEALAAQITGLQDKTIAPQQAAEAVEAAMLQQFSRNEHSVSQRSLAAQNKCSGRFWWRYAKSRCQDTLLLRD